MRRLENIFQQSKYKYFIEFTNNKIIINHLHDYKKIELLLIITNLLDEMTINYLVNEELIIKLHSIN